MSDIEQLRKAFTGLLHTPVVSSAADPQLWALVRHPRRRQVLTEWFAGRLGYRLVVTDNAARVVRTPGGGPVLAPQRFEPPPRRVLVLALLAGVAAEDADDVTTTQDLSDRVRVLSNHDEVEVTSYDPDKYSERSLFVKAVGVLISVGALRPTSRGTEEQRDGWANRSDAVGGAYAVQRELLLRMVEPTALRAALEPDQRAEDAGATPRYSIMRRLLELPALLYEDLTEAESAYLTSQRSRLLSWCTEMTGWVVEQRREGIALIASDEDETDLEFPRNKILDFLAINILDALLRQFAAGPVFTESALLAATAEVRRHHPKAQTKEIASDAQAARKSLELLRALDLVRPGPVDETWILTPPAHRYRNPTLVVTRAQPELEGDE